MAKKFVVVYAGNLHFGDYQFEQDVIIIGRRPDSDIFLKHASVSGAHARLDLRAMTVTDLESTNGTFYGGQRISTAHFQYDKPISIEPYHITVSKRIGKRAARHSDTLVLSAAELAAQGASGNGAAGPADSPPVSAGLSAWLGKVPPWIPLALLGVIIGFTLLLIALSLSGDI